MKPDESTLALIAQKQAQNRAELAAGAKMPKPPVKPMARLRQATKRRK